MPRQKRPRNQDDDADEYSQSYAERHANSRHQEDTLPRTQYEILRDQNFEHLQHEELDDELVTPHVTGQSSNGAPGQVAENGIIESVTCFNFMCHTKLHVELGPLINFVVGENGSGKSAVLTALTLCLGAKPGSTNRGGSLRAFIKEGQDSSMVRVKLKNKGSGAYRHDVYGDSIIVERHFNKTGTSGFRLKNATGSRTISTKRQAVDEIVEHFCLQVDNPLNILSQDMARQFLNSASPAQKYKYFVQGVQLETLDHDYKLVEEILENIEEKLQTHDSHLARLKTEADKAHNLATIVREHEKMREDLRSMRIRLVWSQVIDMEKEITELEERIQFENNAITQLEAALEDANRNIDIHLDRNRKLKEDRERASAEATTFTSEVESAETAYQGYQTEINALHSDERIVRANWQRAKEDISKLKNDIKEEQERLNHATGDARMIKQQELDETQDEYSLKKQDLSEFRAGKPLIQQNIEECQQKISEQEQVVAAKVEQLRNLDEEINRLRRHNGNFLDAYPPNIKRLLDAIESESGWHQKPLGPIGRLVSLKRPEWSASIEKFLGATPLAFLVADKTDMDRLRRLMASCQVKGCPIIKAFDQTLDVTGKEPSPEFDTILRVLEFDNIKVRDVLIMNHTIEQTVLIKERRTAEEVMLSGDHEIKVNIAAVMTFHDHPNQRGNGLIIQSRGGNHSTTPIERYNGPPRLRSDAEAQLQERYKLRQHLNNEYTSLKNQLNDLNEQLYRHRADLDSHERRVKQFEATIRSLTNKITDIEAEMDQFDGSDHRLRGLVSQINEAENSERHNGLQFGAMRVRMTELKEQAAEAKKLVDDKKLELGEFQAKIGKIDVRIDSNTQAMRAVVAAKQSHERDLACHEAEVNNLNLECGKKRDDRDTMEAEARNTFPERVELEEGENFKILYARFRALRSRLESVMAELGASAEVICQREAETMERYQKSKALIEELLTMQEKMRGALSDRIERWRYFQRHLSARTRVNFAYLLTERGYHGKMTIDHRAKILTLQVEPDQNRKSSEGRNTSTLSGGEKSFSSVCMLLSIWEAMGSSIRCLDEFDVFMDNVNRAISTNMLISAARRSVSRQYILITPNAIEGRAQLDKDVKIIRLTDPRQRRIDQM